MFRNFTLTGLLTLATTSAASAQFGVSIHVPTPRFVSPVIVTRPAYHDHHHYHVQYQMPWRDRGFHCHIEAREFERYQEMRGYQAYTVRHGGHWDVRYRLPGWQTYRTVSCHHQAHELEHYLERRGYEARVVHH